MKKISKIFLLVLFFFSFIFSADAFGKVISEGKSDAKV